MHVQMFKNGVESAKIGSIHSRVNHDLPSQITIAVTEESLGKYPFRQ